MSISRISHLIGWAPVGHLRILELIGSGRTSVRHSRSLGAVYDSDVVSPLGANSKWIVFIGAKIKKHTHSCLLIIVLGIQLSSERERGLHERALRSGASLPVQMSFIEVPMKKSSDDPTVVMEHWPILLPSDFVPCHLCFSFFWIEALKGKTKSESDVPSFLPGVAEASALLSEGYLEALVDDVGNLPGYWKDFLEDFPRHMIQERDPNLNRSVGCTLYCA